MRDVSAGTLRAVRAAIEFVESLGDGLVLGLGSGRTAETLIRELAERPGSRTGLIREVVATSLQSEVTAASLNFRTISPLSGSIPDIYVDSFDQSDGKGNVVKGGGGALAREKILMFSSRRVLMIGDETKLRERIDMPIPVEVIPFGCSYFKRFAESRGWRPAMRTGAGKFGPVVTDNGNILFDVSVPVVDDPIRLEVEMKMIPGVVEAGIFPNRGYKILVGRSDGSVTQL
ncbi:MAG: ribose 5-phosphate isomerase A [Aigarchaeota archaeon]|nr:ribose 5-phosphate isomerase A [Aigarchaeota archaeon]MDW8093310.1 ribose 5-phosphate isomerase A [Nitrososphaerota archaeon]